jgi:predicted ATPase/DNA-binding CsgD family transcriptional regulator
MSSTSQPSGAAGRHLTRPIERGGLEPHPAKVSAAARAERFVGRRRELEALRAAFAAAAVGRGRIVMLAGEPGIGKTRTAQELAMHAAREGAGVLWGRCPEESGAPPYWPWVQIIRAVLPDADREFLAGLGAAAGDIANIVAEIRGRLPGPEQPAPLGDPSEARFRMFESIRQFLIGLSRRRPLLLVLDDLHWADAPSLRLLEFLAPEFGGSRVLLIGTYRATELSRQHPLSNALGALARAPQFTRVNLAGLNAEEVEAFIAAAGATVPVSLAKALYDQTEGNPLFLREIVRFLEQRGALGEADVPSAIRIPEGVTEVIGRRLNLLSAGTNEVLALASVMGRDFSGKVLARAAEPLGEDPLLEALDEAVAACVIEETATGQYRFTHNLIRVTLYDELRISRRRQYHRAVAGALETIYGADLDPHFPELARHFQAAGGDTEAEKAIDYAVRAGRRADALLAFEDAAQFFQSALDAIEQRAELDEAARCRVLLLLGVAFHKSADFRQAQATLHNAAELARRLGLYDTMGRAALAYERATWRNERIADAPTERVLAEALQLVPENETALRVELTGALARALLYAGAETEARKLLAPAIDLARQFGDPNLLAITLNYLFDFPWGPADTSELLARTTECLEAAVQARNLEIMVLARSRRAVALLELGDTASAEREIANQTRFTAQIRRREHSAGLNALRAMLALMRGELEAAEHQMIEAMRQVPHTGASQLDYFSMQIFSLRREQGRLKALLPVIEQLTRQTGAGATWRPGLALLWVELDRLDEARAEFEYLAARDFTDLSRDGRWTTCIVYLAEVCAALGDAARAAILYRLLAPYGGQNIVLGGGIACCGSAGRFLGMLCSAMGRWSEAQRHFEAALAMNERIGARVPLAHTRHDYAAMLLARNEAGDREHALELLKASLEAAREIGMRTLEDRLSRRLDELSGSRMPDDLTAREAEVLRLIAIGRSNADIAMALSISVNTVATHVRNILAKTGCVNRTEAAAFALRQGWRLDYIRCRPSPQPSPASGEREGPA